MSRKSAREDSSNDVVKEQGIRVKQPLKGDAFSGQAATWGVS